MTTHCRCGSKEKDCVYPKCHNGEWDSRQDAPKLSQAAHDVLTERRRQVEAEGWTPEHDDGYEDGQLAKAAACYANSASGNSGHGIWPWDRSWWKPSDPRRNLVKAAALIIAEIERLDRAEEVKDQPHTNG